MHSNRNIGLFSLSIDYFTVLIYLVLVVMGWVSIYSAVYSPESGSIFDLSQRYGMQMVWIGVSFTLAIVILLMDSKYFHLISYQLYFLSLLLMVGVLLFGKEVNGAKSWIGIGPIGIQPVEFMKIATALALAKFMSSSHFSIGMNRQLRMVGAIIFVPILIVLLQNDTGSAMVFSAFFVVLYREGFGQSLYLASAYLALVAILSFFITQEALIVLVLLSCLLFELFTRDSKFRSVKLVSQFIAIILAIFISIELLSMLLGFECSLLVNLLISIGATIPLLLYTAYRSGSRTLANYIGLLIAGIAVILFVDYAFENVLQGHQRERILDLMGIENDPRGAGYNAMQSKIAIGSGGLMGKGFLQGTQTQFSFVPEQSTDFIYCTVGEEWGFVGSMVVLILFGLLIYRLMRMGERQKEPFARIYCYSAAAIIFVHMFINIAMTVGLFPVVGIPLPFFSYGGSSLMAFTILVFIAIRLDGSQSEGTSRKLL